MQRRFTAIVHDAEEGGYWATCAEVPEANAQGESLEELLEDLKASIALVLGFKREQGIEPLVAPTRLMPVEIADAGQA